MAASFDTKPHAGTADCPLYLLDFNYADRRKTASCFTEIAQARARYGLDFSTKTLVLAAKGLHPSGPELFALVREFRAHHVFFELWNGLREVVELANAKVENVYYLP